MLTRTKPKSDYFRVMLVTLTPISPNDDFVQGNHGQLRLGVLTMTELKSKSDKLTLTPLYDLLVHMQ